MKEITFRLKDVLAAVGWHELVSWRAKEALSHYRALLAHFGGDRTILRNSFKLARLRRNRELVKAVGKDFADYVQVELDFTCYTKVMTFPSWYTEYSRPYRERIFKPMHISALDVQKAAIQETDYTDYSLTPMKFGDTKGRRLAAAYLPETDTVYISDVWKLAS